MLFITVNMRKFTDSRDSLLQEIITNNGPINKYAFVGDIGVGGGGRGGGG